MVFWVGGLLIELFAWVVEVDEKEDIFSFNTMKGNRWKIQWETSGFERIQWMKKN